MDESAIFRPRRGCAGGGVRRDERRGGIRVGVRRGRGAHRLLVVLVVTHAGEEVDAEAAARGHGEHGDRLPLFHLGCGWRRGGGRGGDAD